MPGIHITDIEAAINYWREKKPSPDGVTLAPELRALAEVYALMIFYHEEEAQEQGFPPAAYAAWKAKSQQTVDNAQMRYFIVHMHRLLDPASDPSSKR